jgi:CII-binding regulator of phage lambda lysogenization HflD
MTDLVKNRTIALAGLFQSVRLVQQTARGEPRDKETTAASIGSIFNTNPATAVDVYGDIEAIRTGLEVLVQQLGNDNKRRDMELTRYVVTLMHLEHKLSRKPGPSAPKLKHAGNKLNLTMSSRHQSSLRWQNSTSRPSAPCNREFLLMVSPRYSTTRTARIWCAPCCWQAYAQPSCCTSPEAPV